MRLKRGLGLAATALVVVSASYAAAASLGALSTGPLGAGTSAITSCDTNGVTSAYTLVAGAVTEVTVSGIADPNCEGAKLSLTLVDDTGASIGSATNQNITTDEGTTDNSVVVPVSLQPMAEDVTGIHIVIVGP